MSTEKPRRSWLPWLAIPLLLAAAWCARVFLWSDVQVPDGTTTAETSHPDPLPDGPIGNPEAKLHVTMVLGPCITSLAQGVAECAAAWPELIYAEFYALMAEEGGEIVKAHGDTLASIYFNDVNEFTVETDEGEKEIVFHGPPGTNYVYANIGLVLRDQLLATYGELPEGCEEKLAVFGGQEPE